MCIKFAKQNCRRKQNPLLRWRFVDKLSCEEIAAQLGRTVQAVYAMIKRSRQTLRDCVEARAHG